MPQPTLQIQLEILKGNLDVLEERFNHHLVDVRNGMEDVKELKPKLIMIADHESALKGDMNKAGVLEQLRSQSEAVKGLIEISKANMLLLENVRRLMWGGYGAAGAIGVVWTVGIVFWQIVIKKP